MTLVRLFAMVSVWGLLVTQTLAANTVDEWFDSRFDVADEYLVAEVAVDASMAGCNAEDRDAYIYNGNTKFADATDDCGRAAFGSSRLTAQCLSKGFPGLSASCAKCFGDMVHCAAVNCYAVCAAGTSNPGCIQCAKRSCTPELVSCTGVAAIDLPAK